MDASCLYADVWAAPIADRHDETCSVKWTMARAEASAMSSRVTYTATVASAAIPLLPADERPTDRMARLAQGGAHG